METFNILDLIKYKEHYDWEYNSNNYNTEDLYKVIFSPKSFGFGQYKGTEMNRLEENSYLCLSNYTFIGNSTICRLDHKIKIASNLKLVPITFEDFGTLKEALDVVDSMYNADDRYLPMLLKYLKSIVKLSVDHET